ncbi:MAG: triphosphoribosyl-dephospho-CoA synthase [[Eubacterium] sulci]|nr:triphosphoribosyl-dephospho-CoA synthase [[Eubacterium] sulci]
MYEIRKVELAELLKSRDEKALLKSEFIDRYKMPVVSLSMNIAGEIKRSPLVDLAFEYGYSRLIKELGEPKKSLVKCDFTGCFALLVFDLEAELLKSKCLAIEEELPVGRLLDLDVTDAIGMLIRRPDTKGRKCLVCGGPVFECSRARAHGLDDVIFKTQNILLDFASDKISKLAVSALKEELELTPKPGLVDQRNCGAHSDMDFDMMLRSAMSLKVYFENTLRLGFDMNLSNHCELIKLRNLGIEAEKRMMHLTSGVNTHRGAIYGMGILLSALGNCLKHGGSLVYKSRKIAEGLFELKKCSSDLECNKHVETTKILMGKSNGELAREAFGRCGAEDEAMKGFPTAFAGACYLEDLVNKYGRPTLIAKLRSFLFILEKADDSNLIHRGGRKGLELAKTEARRIRNLDDDKLVKALEELDDVFIEMNLSPGGTADIYAQSLLLQKIKNHLGSELW